VKIRRSKSPIEKEQAARKEVAKVPGRDEGEMG